MQSVKLFGWIHNFHSYLMRSLFLKGNEQSVHCCWKSQNIFHIPHTTMIRKLIKSIVRHFHILLKNCEIPFLDGKDTLFCTQRKNERKKNQKLSNRWKWIFLWKIPQMRFEFRIIWFERNSWFFSQQLYFINEQKSPGDWNLVH